MTDTTIDGVEIDSTPITFRDFVHGLQNGALIRHTETGQVFIWTNAFSRPYTAELINAESAVLEEFSMHDENKFALSDSDMTQQQILHMGLVMLQATRDLKRKIEEKDCLERDLNASIVSAQEDWDKLNSFINDYADSQGMCPDYERRLDDWNESFNWFSLQGREKEWRVNVRVTAEWTETRRVTARSERQARESVTILSDQENYNIIKEESNPELSVDITDAWV